MDRTRALAGAALVGMAVAAGCSGGGAGNPIPQTTTAPASTVKFTITVPLTSASDTARRPQFEAPSGTQSVSFQLSSVNGSAQTSSTPTVVNVSASATGCSTANNTLTCTASVPGVAGDDLYTVTSFPQPNAQGTAIASGTVQVTTTAGTTVTAPVTLSGTIASIALSFQGIGIRGQAGTIPLVVIAKDANGATIMGTYASPITLADSDASGATKLSATTLSDSTAASKVTLSYDGSALTGATISATAGGVASSKITNAIFTPNADYAAVNGSTLSYAMSGTAQTTSGTGTPEPLQTASATETDAYTTGATFGKFSNLVKVNQTISAATVLASNTSTTVQSAGVQSFAIGLFLSDRSNFYYAFNPTPTGATVNEMGVEAVTDPATNTDNWQSKTVATGSGWEVAQLPFKANNAWDAGSGSVSTSTYDTTVYNGTQDVPATNSDVYSQNKDGSYTETYSRIAKDGSFTESTDLTTVNSDGTASDVWKDNYETDTTTIGKPQPAPSGTPGTVIPITETMTLASPSPGPTATPTVTYVPNWYPNGQVPSPLQTDKAADKGSVAIPQKCNIPSSTATNAELIHEDYSNFDPYGYVETDSDDYYYVSGVGLVCAVVHLDWKNYEWDTGTPWGSASMDLVKSLSSTQLQSALRTASSMSQAASIAGQGLRTSVIQHQVQYRKQLQSLRATWHTHAMQSLRHHS